MDNLLPDFLLSCWFILNVEIRLEEDSKIIISALFALSLILYAFSPKLEQVTLSADTGQIYDINSQIPIGVDTVPTDYKLQCSSFDVSGGEITEEDGQFLFSASEPGEYTVNINVAGAERNQRL